MINYILKYETSNLIIIYYYTYSGLLNTVGDIVWNFMELIRGIGLKLMSD